MKKRSAPAPALPRLPTVCTRCFSSDGRTVREHRRLVRGAHPKQSARTVFCELSGDDAAEFNAFCREAAYRFEEKTLEKFRRSASPGGALFSLTLSPAAPGGLMLLTMHLQSSGEGKKGRTRVRRYVLDSSAGRLVRMRDLTKNQKKTILN